MCPPEAAKSIFTTITQNGLTTVLLTHYEGDEIGKASRGMFQGRQEIRHGGKVNCHSVAATNNQSPGLNGYQENE